MENNLWSESDEKVLNSKIKHLITVLELKKNKISLQEYIRFIKSTKTNFERTKYIEKLGQLLGLDDDATNIFELYDT